MIDYIPNYVTIVFVLCTLFSLFMSYYVVSKSKSHGQYAKTITLIILIYLIWQGAFAYSGFYTEGNDSFPPRLGLSALPALLTIVFLFITKKGKAFVDSLSLKTITYWQVVRIPVELCLYWLFLVKAVPEVMTFAGRNQDILVGITAPIIAFFAFRGEEVVRKKLLLVWNIAGFFILLNIIIHGTLSAPTFMQQFGFEQPNIALLNFPFVWLQGFVAPVALLGHLIGIRQLLKK